MRLEKHSIGFVPIEERRGHVASLFPLWFGANLQITTIAAGAIAVNLGLSFSWAVVASVAGNLFGAVFMALHSAQGPALGIPQMIQSRAQFGVYGAMLPLTLVALMYLGYFATTGIQGGQALSSLVGLDFVSSVSLIALATAGVAMFGYRVIHQTQRWLSVFGVATFGCVTVAIVVRGDLSGAWVFQGFSWPSFLTAAAVAATWQLTYAPYVADYSRYLPEDTSSRAAFWYTYLGSALSSTWMFGLGAAAASIAGKGFTDGSVEFVANQVPALRTIVLLVITAGVIGINSLNLYGLFMSLATIFDSFKRTSISVRVRALLIGTSAAAAAALGVVGQEDFLNNFTAFISLLAYLLVPWSAINLISFYVRRNERSFTTIDLETLGQRRTVHWQAMAAYFLGVAVEIPFTVADFYTGAFAHLVGGVDLSWIVGLLAGGGAYVMLARVHPRRKEQSTQRIPDDGASSCGLASA